MKTSIKYILKVICTGFVVLLLFSAFLFWILKIGQVTFYANFVINTIGEAKLSPSGIVSREIIEREPNIIPSEVSTESNDSVVIGTLGLFDNLLQDRVLFWGRPGGLGNIYYGFDFVREHRKKIVYFDKSLGLFVLCRIVSEDDGHKKVWSREIELYAGPEGVSDKPEEKLGRFVEPQDAHGFYDIEPLVVFDKGTRQFLSIDFKNRKVTKGKVIKEHNIIAFGSPSKNGFNYFLGWVPPLRPATREELNDNMIMTYTREINGRNVRFVPIDGFRHPWSQPFGVYLVLTDKGEVFPLETGSLGLGPKVAFMLRPDKQLDYAIIPVEYQDRHIGSVAGWITGDAHKVEVRAFNENGAIVKEEDASLQRAYDFPGGPLYIVCKYLVENLHSPILLLGSYLTADSFEAKQSHRSLFLLPQSWVAFFSRDHQERGNSMLLFALLFISPSIGLASLLAGRVYKDAVKTGFSPNARIWWIVATVAFGIGAYITYFVTKPKETLVTCKNCGKLRRPDMDTCHRCGSGWEVPELTPPSWRVMD